MGALQIQDEVALRARFGEVMSELDNLMAVAREMGVRLWEPGEPEPFVPVAETQVIVLEPSVEDVIEETRSPTVAQSGCVIQRPPPFASNWRNVLREYLRTFREGETVDAEMRRLNDLVRDQERLGRFPPDIQVGLLTYAAARLRELQARRLVEDKRVFSIISVIAAYAQRSRVGFVYGPKRDDDPKTDTWAQDADEQLRVLRRRADETLDGQPNAQRHIDRIRALVADAAPFEEIVPLVREALAAGVPARHPQLITLAAPFFGNLTAREFKKLRSAVRAASEIASDPETVASLPDDWRWFPSVRGKHAVIVGGNPCEPNRIRIQAAFGFASLEWEGTESRRNPLQQVRDRIRSGGTDFLIILRRFVGHDTDEILLPACREKGIPWVSVISGYGIQRIRSEIERMVPIPPTTP